MLSDLPLRQLSRPRGKLVLSVQFHLVLHSKSQLMVMVAWQLLVSCSWQ
jgi:hypothetical protein